MRIQHGMFRYMASHRTSCITPSLKLARSAIKS